MVKLSLKTFFFSNHGKYPVLSCTDNFNFNDNNNHD